MMAWPDLVGLGILVTELPHVARKRSSAARDRRADRSSLRLLWIAIVAGIAGAYLARARAVGPAWTVDASLVTIALSTCALGFAVRTWAVVTLGRFFTVDVAIREGHALVTTGPFRFVRHPSYTGLVLLFVGWSLTFGQALSVAALLVPTFLALAYRIHVEEIALTRAFGASYDAYRARTKRLVPFAY